LEEYYTVISIWIKEDIFIVSVTSISDKKKRQQFLDYFQLQDQSVAFKSCIFPNISLEQ